MKEYKAIIGGEGSGGVILPESHFGRDSLVGTVLILALMASKNKKISQLNNELPQYSMLKTKQNFSGNLYEYIKLIKNIFPNALFDEQDGIKIILPKSWVQLRTSNTEPIIRIIAEAVTKEETEKLIQNIKHIINKYIKH